MSLKTNRGRRGCHAFTGPLLSAFALALLGAAIACGAARAAARTPAPPRPGLYLLAATPDIYGMYGFPVTLYTTGPRRRTRLVRRIFTFAPGYMDVRPDGRGRIYVVDENGLSIIHEAHPERDDLVLAPGPNSIRRGAPVTNWAARGYWAAWGVAAGPDRGSAAIFSDSENGRPGEPAFVVLRVAGRRRSGAPRITVGGWTAYRSFFYRGPGGGPYPEIPAGARITRAGIQFGPVFHPGAGLVSAGPRNLSGAAGSVARVVSGPGGSRRVVSRGALVVAATPRWFAFRAPLPGHAGGWPKRIYVHNRRTGRWFTLKLPYMKIPPRLFGDWLCTIVQEPNPNGLPSPGLGNERQVAYRPRGNLYPNIRGAYKRDMYMPGVLELRNLATGQVVKIFTGQQDSEVLGVAADGRVAYRVNDRVLVARMRGHGVGPAALATEGPDVPEVHWIFCRGGGDIGACLPRPPSGASAPPRSEVKHNPRASR